MNQRQAREFARTLEACTSVREFCRVTPFERNGREWVVRLTFRERIVSITYLEPLLIGEVYSDILSVLDNGVGLPHGT